MRKNNKILTITLALSAFLMTSCERASKVASHNLSKAADEFQLERRVVFFNGITDKYLLTIEGKCSIKDELKQLEVTCKTGADEFKKHFLGLSDNVSYLVEQLEPKKVSTYHYSLVFKPQSLIPDVDFKGSLKDIPTTDSSD